jgi:hypothetical protein
MRRTRLTADAKKSRRRKVACGHFRVRNCRVTSDKGVFDQAICRECRKIVEEQRVDRNAPYTYGGEAPR